MLSVVPVLGSIFFRKSSVLVAYRGVAYKKTCSNTAALPLPISLLLYIIKARVSCLCVYRILAVMRTFFLDKIFIKFYISKINGKIKNIDRCRWLFCA